MNRYTSTKLLLVLLLSAFLLSFTAKPYKANYAGSWKLNEQKSELDDFGKRIAPQKLKIEQKDDQIIIARTGTRFDGAEYTTSETITFDGKIAETTVYETSKKKSSIKWAEDGNSFVITSILLWNANGETTEVNITENWSLGSDGKTLMVDSKSSSSMGELNMKMTFDK
jgi:hypothetical protein